MKIVVVDDSPEIVEVVSIYLQLRWSDSITASLALCSSKNTTTNFLPAVI